MPETDRRKRPSATEEEVAFAIAQLLLDQIEAPDKTAAVVAALHALGLFSEASEASRANEIAELVLRPLPAFSSGTAESRAARDNALWRGEYAVAAAKRLSQAADTEKALRTEESYFEAHLNAGKRRIAGARINDAAVERYGNVLSWHHTKGPVNAREHHLKADGANYDASGEPPHETGAWPGQLPNCGCVPGPPKAGARLLR